MEDHAQGVVDLSILEEVQRANLMCEWETLTTQ